MTDILPPAGWPNVRQLETNEFATGGANGNMNEQAKSLAARSELLKQYAALPYESKTGGYALNERVQLATGDIVRSTIPSNVNNPNENMTGWVKANDASQIFDESEKNQQEINNEQSSFSMYQQSVVNKALYNIPENYGANSASPDNTVALQTWLDSSETLHLNPFKTYKFSGALNLNVVNQSIIGLTHNTYGNSRLIYTGSGVAVQSTKNVGYLRLVNMQLLGEVTTANAVFENGTTGLDLRLGGTVDASGFFLNGFETLSLSSGTTFYNKFVNCRFSDFRNGFVDYASYNLNFFMCRFLQFTDALNTNGGAGPLNIISCSFERFNGAIHRSNNDKCELNFINNYVEIYDKIELPVNFVKATDQPLGDFFGGNILFRGYYGKLSIRNNKMSIGGVFRVGAFSACDHLESVGNGISLYQSNNNLGLLFSSGSPYKSVNINDVNNGALTGDGGYSRAYARSSFNSIETLRNPYFYYDCILGSVQPLIARLVTFTPALILNGWSISNAVGSTSVKALANADGTTTITGAVTGTSKTGNVILNIPVTNRPSELGVTQAYMLLFTKSQGGVADCVLKYTYASGDLEYVSGASPLSNIVLNFTIPQRT